MNTKKIILLVIVLLMSSVSFAQRYALVIGNSSYKIGFLKNPVNDASDMAALLGKKGFQVQKLTDANKKQMEQAIHKFTQQLHQKDSVGLFYFAGHGTEVEGQNYLLPVGKNFQSEADVKYDGVNAGRILFRMKKAGNGLNMVILDACRDNPFARSFRSSSRGLAKMEARGSMVFYATSPGDVASDGNGRNGLFTQHLMASINTPNLTIDQVFNRTANKVAAATADKQLPWKSGSIVNIDQFRFTINAPKAETITINQPVANSGQAEIVFWDGIKNETAPDFFRSYLQKYPQGIYVELAKIKIQRDGTIVVVKPPKAEKQETAQLTIKTSPDHARIRILNIAPKYQQRIELKPGRYHVEVSQTGYKRHTEWIELKNEDTIHSVVLEEKQQVVPVTQTRIKSRPSRNNNSGIAMVSIPSGCFQMGSNSSLTYTEDEKPIHRVCLSAYEIGKYEVTQAQWQKVMNN